jgi:hypothetical protein
MLVLFKRFEPGGKRIAKRAMCCDADAHYPGEAIGDPIVATTDTCCDAVVA